MTLSILSEAPTTCIAPPHGFHQPGTAPVKPIPELSMKDRLLKSSVNVLYFPRSSSASILSRHIPGGMMIQLAQQEDG